MAILKKLKHIGVEFKGHAPFTLAGTAIGLVCMLSFKAANFNPAILFKIFHPGHVLLSAMVTASIYSLHAKKKSFLTMLVVGYVGAIGVATISDCVMPYLGEKLFKLDIPSHAEVFHGPGGHGEDEHNAEKTVEETSHQEDGYVDAAAAHGEEGHVCQDDADDGHEHAEDADCPEGVLCDHDHSHGLHLGFIEDWYIVNPAAFLGVLIAFMIPRSKCPHAAHVLLSTWASTAHVLMNLQTDMTVEVLAATAVIIFFAVWVPCCVSDIVFPLLFVDSDLDMSGSCMCHGTHSHGQTGDEK